MLTYILDGMEILVALVAIAACFGVASVATLLTGGFLTLLFAGASTAKLVDDPY